MSVTICTATSTSSPPPHPHTHALLTLSSATPCTRSSLPHQPLHAPPSLISHSMLLPPSSATPCSSLPHQPLYAPPSLISHSMLLPPSSATPCSSLPHPALHAPPSLVSHSHPSAHFLSPQPLSVTPTPERDLLNSCVRVCVCVPLHFVISPHLHPTPPRACWMCPCTAALPCWNSSAPR